MRKPSLAVIIQSCRPISNEEQPEMVETAFEKTVPLIETYNFLDGRIAILYLVLK
jgi:hypothetical protein